MSNLSTEDILRIVGNIRRPLGEARTVRRRPPPLTFARSVEILEGIVGRIERSLRRARPFEYNQDAIDDWKHIDRYVSDEFTEFNRINDRLEKENIDINEYEYDFVRRHHNVQDEAMELFDEWRDERFERIRLERDARNVRRRLS